MKKYIYALILTLGLAAGALLPATTYAVDLFPNCNANLTLEQCKLLKQDDLNKNKPNNAIWSIVRVALAALGGIAVIMIVIGGLRYTMSRGDSGAVSSAKQTILFSVIGLVVALLASGLVLLISNYFG